MKSQIFLFLLLLPLLALAAPMGAASAPEFDAVDACLAAQVRADRTPGLAVGIVQNGEVVHTAGFGFADRAGAPVTPQTPFVIGSISKGFTALAVLQLAEAGRLDLDAPVQTYLPWFTLADPQAAARITLRHLLNQNSGLGYNDSTRPMWDRPGEFTLEARLRQFPLQRCDLRLQGGEFRFMAIPVAARLAPAILRFLRYRQEELTPFFRLPRARRARIQLAQAFQPLPVQAVRQFGQHADQCPRLALGQVAKAALRRQESSCYAAAKRLYRRVWNQRFNHHLFKSLYSTFAA